jgi:hypothetical protein
MPTLKLLLDLACGRRLPEEDSGQARRLQLILLAGLGTAIFAALYGLAAGSAELSLALGNTWKVPMVLLLSTGAALPGGLLAWYLVSEKSPGEMLLAAAVANFTAAMVLAVLAPLVALYYHSSAFLGGAIALGSCVLALLCGVAILLRTIHARTNALLSLRVGGPTAILVGLQLLAMIQFISLASPILPEITVFDGGADAIVGSR